MRMIADLIVDSLIYQERGAEGGRVVGDTVYLLLLLPAAPFLQLEAEHHARTDVVEGQRIPVLK